MNINEIIEKIKDILSNELNNKRVFDKDVAAALNLSKQSLSILRPPLHKGTKCDIRFKSSLNSARLNLLNPYK